MNPSNLSNIISFKVGDVEADSATILAVGYYSVIAFTYNAEKFIFHGDVVKEINSHIGEQNVNKIEGYLIAKSDESYLIKISKYPVVKVKIDQIDLSIILLDNKEK